MADERREQRSVSVIARREHEPSRSRVGAALAYRHDLQWLRALAVLVVVAYHLHLPGFSGGFVGVDVFFVVSGYLITRLLLDELQRTARIELRRFALRRIRRLLPVSTLVFLVTLAMLWFAQEPLRRSTEAIVARATALFGANFGLIAVETNYLTASDESAFQHYWSLAVEEQFYLLWPALLLTTATVSRWAGVRREVALWRTLVAIGLVSLVAAMVLTDRSPSHAFFILPARGWELIAGGLLAVREVSGSRPQPRYRREMRFVGLGAVGAVILGVGNAWTFPWPLALVPVGGTAAVIWAGVGEDPPPKWLRSPLMQWVGDRSYAIYLWHWPPLVILGLSDRTWSAEPVLRVFVIVWTFAAAAMTYRLVEEPLRSGQLIRTWRAGFTFLISAVAVSLIAATLVTRLPEAFASGPAVPAARFEDLASGRLSSPPFVPANLRPTIIEALDSVPFIYENGCHVGFGAERPKDVSSCTFGDPKGRTTVLLTGDSHAAHWFEAAVRPAEANGWRLIVATKSGCPIYDVAVTLNGRRHKACDAWRDALLELIDDIDPDVTLVGGATGPGVRLDARPWLEGARRGVSSIRRAVEDGTVVMLLDTPRPMLNVPVCLAERMVEACAAQESVEFDSLQREMARETVDEVVDAMPYICIDGSCPAIIGDVMVYRDGSHLSAAVAGLLSPLVEDAVRAHNLDEG